VQYPEERRFVKYPKW